MPRAPDDQTTYVAGAIQRRQVSSSWEARLDCVTHGSSGRNGLVDRALRPAKASPGARARHSVRQCLHICPVKSNLVSDDREFLRGLLRIGLAVASQQSVDWAWEHLLDWPRLDEVLHLTSMAPLLGHHIATAEAPIRDRPAGRALRSALAESRNRSARLRAVAEQLCQEFDSEGIGFAFRKGPALLALYPSEGCRPYGDLDLYVDRSDLPTSLSTLYAMGFTEPALSREQRTFLLLSTNSFPPLLRDGVSVDIASSILLPRRDHHHAAQMLKEMLRRTRDEDGLKILQPADLMVDLSVNLHQCHTSLRYVHRQRHKRLINYIDIALLSGRLSVLDWKVFDRTVKYLQIREEVDFAFGNCLRLFSDFSGREELSRRIGLPNASIDRVGVWELQEPYVWRYGLLRRVLEPVPQGIPQPNAPRYDR